MAKPGGRAIGWLAAWMTAVSSATSLALGIAVVCLILIWMGGGGRNRPEPSVHVKLARSAIVGVFLATFLIANHIHTRRHPGSGAALKDPFATLEPANLEPADVDNDWRLRAVGEQTDVRLSRWTGQVVVVKVWDLRAEPCRWEVPGLVRLREAFDDSDGVVFVPVVGDDNARAADQLIRQAGWREPVYRAVEAPPDALRAAGVPATFVIGRGGRVRLRFVGAADWSGPRMVEFLRDLAAERTPASQPTATTPIVHDLWR